MESLGQRGVTHCSDNAADRELGEYWERQFCEMMADRGKVFTPMQIGRSSSASAYFKTDGRWNQLTLPDVTIWSSPGEHHEIKHKNPNKHGSYGLEKYRLNALVDFANVSKQKVLYTIHNHRGNRLSRTNSIVDWVTANVLDLQNSIKGEWPGFSWVGGEKKKVPICYWHEDEFKKLFDLKFYW